ncbi:MAG: hypothetical protein AB7U92_11425 [Piscinibacter sp.]|uniref:hypothetical protein n=1 Tax=Piscinibacter sp. TaxID=1903157 RepID=UPI003D129780
MDRDNALTHRRGLLLAFAALALSACGGGGDDAGSPGVPSPPPPDNSARIAAATATAASSSNACAAIRPFYWEIGDRSTALASGAVGGTTYGAGTTMNIASASKWLYGAYVVQRRAGAPTAEDIKHLTFRSGYTRFAICLPGQTVDGCLNYLNNGEYVPASDGRFDYGGGHMQKHASLIGLGALNNASLAAELRGQLGSDIVLTFSQPQPAGGVVSTPADYARFLRKLLGGSLALGSLLGSQAVCTNPLTCPTADGTPVPTTESWHYSLGHWVEDDPVVGDGAFSSAGAFGFYPWIDAGRTHYGIVAREAAAGSGEASVNCGRLIRKAWVTGIAG